MAHISFIGCRLSTYPEDTITVGMLFVNEGETQIKISEHKMKILKKILNKHVFSLFESSVKGLVKNVEKLNLDKIDYLHRYQNGLLKIYKPTQVSLEHIESKETFFEDYFNKRVDKYS